MDELPEEEEILSELSPSSSSEFEEGDGAAEEEEEEFDEEDEEEEVVKKDPLPLRSTRGIRYQKLEEEEADIEFWKQPIFQEEDDEEVHLEDFSSSELDDSEDSDIDLDENEDEEDLEKEELDEERRAKRKEKQKKGGYVDPALIIAKRKKILEERKKLHPKKVLGERTMGVRTSTKKLTEMKEKQLKELAKNKTKRKRKHSVQQQRKQVRFSQRELLEEAALTEIANKRSLEQTLLMQAEIKKQRMLSELSENALTGPRIIFKSSKVLDKTENNGHFVERSTLRYTDPSTVPSFVVF